MSLFYSLAYRLGFTPWEHAAIHPPAVSQINSLFEREEQSVGQPFGRALDLGCGTGHWSVVLAKRGWQVTGVDLVPQAVRAARQRVQRSGVAVEILLGDVTRLRDAGVKGNYRLVWDFGTVHGLSEPQREAVGRELSLVAGRPATVLLLAWKPARRAPLPRGMSRAEIEHAFPDWRITDEEPFDATGLPGPLRGVEPRVYRLERA